GSPTAWRSGSARCSRSPSSSPDVCRERHRDRHYDTCLASERLACILPAGRDERTTRHLKGALGELWPTARRYASSPSTTSPMLAGAREFLVKPFSADELINAIRHVHELEKVKRARYAAVAPAAASPANPLAAAPAARDTGKIITFFSPKGGVGRTTIATNLAVAIHQYTQKPVVIVDCSIS